MAVPLVAIGDSLSHGVTSGGICRTDIAYPALIARCLGEPDLNQFKRPDFTGEGGLPLNIEQLLRLLVDKFGNKIDFFEIPRALLAVQNKLDRVEDFWERGEGTRASDTGPLHHNLGVLGFQLGDFDTLTDAVCRRVLQKKPRNNLLQQLPELAMYRATRRTLNPSLDNNFEWHSQFTAAREVARTQNGIENLIFWLGSNNCLGTVISLKINWSKPQDIDNLAYERSCNLWQPEHFRKILNRIVPQIRAINATNVFLATIPHVTIPPVSRGITPGRTGTDALTADGYYEFYTHFWIWDDEFSKNPEQYPHLVGAEAKLIDSVIDQYNQAIKDVADAEGFHVVDLCEKLDQLAFRRRGGQVTYPFPEKLIDALQTNGLPHRISALGRPLLDTRYIRLTPNDTNEENRHRGGLIGLDGFHPTPVCYGLIADEFLLKMNDIGVAINRPQNWWNDIVRSDGLLMEPPKNLEHLENTLGFLYHHTPIKKILDILRGAS